MPCRTLTLDFAAMSALARENGCPPCRRCHVNFTANAKGICSRCLRTLAVKRTAAIKRRTLAPLTLKPSMCCRCDAAEVSGPDRVCQTCELEIADVKARIRSGELVVAGED